MTTSYNPKHANSILIDSLLRAEQQEDPLINQPGHYGEVKNIEEMISDWTHQIYFEQKKFSELLIEIPADDENFLQKKPVLACSVIYTVIREKVTEICSKMRVLIFDSYMLLLSKRSANCDMKHSSDSWNVNFYTHRNDSTLEQQSDMNKVYGPMANLICTYHNSLLNSNKEIYEMWKLLYQLSSVKDLDFKTLHYSLNELVLEELTKDYPSIEMSPQRILPTLSNQRKHEFVFKEMWGFQKRKATVNFLAKSAPQKDENAKSIEEPKKASLNCDHIIGAPKKVQKGQTLSPPKPIPLNTKEIGINTVQIPNPYISTLVSSLSEKDSLKKKAIQKQVQLVELEQQISEIKEGRLKILEQFLEQNSEKEAIVNGESDQESEEQMGQQRGQESFPTVDMALDYFVLSSKNQTFNEQKFHKFVESTEFNEHQMDRLHFIRMKFLRLHGRDVFPPQLQTRYPLDDFESSSSSEVELSEKIEDIEQLIDDEAAMRELEAIKILKNAESAAIEQQSLSKQSEKDSSVAHSVKRQSKQIPPGKHKGSAEETELSATLKERLNKLNPNQRKAIRLKLQEILAREEASLVESFFEKEYNISITGGEKSKGAKHTKKSEASRDKGQNNQQDRQATSSRDILDEDLPDLLSINTGEFHFEGFHSQKSVLTMGKTEEKRYQFNIQLNRKFSDEAPTDSKSFLDLCKLTDSQTFKKTTDSLKQNLKHKTLVHKKIIEKTKKQAKEGKYEIKSAKQKVMGYIRQSSVVQKSEFTTNLGTLDCLGLIQGLTIDQESSIKGITKGNPRSKSEQEYLLKIFDEMSQQQEEERKPQAEKKKKKKKRNKKKKNKQKGEALGDKQEIAEADIQLNNQQLNEKLDSAMIMSEHTKKKLEWLKEVRNNRHKSQILSNYISDSEIEQMEQQQRERQIELIEQKKRIKLQKERMKQEGSAPGEKNTDASLDLQAGSETQSQSSGAKKTIRELNQEELKLYDFLEKLEINDSNRERCLVTDQALDSIRSKTTFILSQRRHQDDQASRTHSTEPRDRPFLRRESSLTTQPTESLEGNAGCSKKNGKPKKNKKKKK